ncbi:MAG TPA: hypothetical protein VMR43_17555 [Variovorax sp.]|nr:hypothetical protein [Variovorax sp.]
MRTSSAPSSTRDSRHHDHADPPPVGRDTRLCMSLAARPGSFGSRFHDRLHALLGLDHVYQAFTTTDLAGAVGGIRPLGIRGCAGSTSLEEAVIPMLDGLDASGRDAAGHGRHRRRAVRTRLAGEQSASRPRCAWKRASHRANS